MKRRAYTGGALIAMAVAGCGVSVPSAQNPATDGNLSAQVQCDQMDAGAMDASALKAAIDSCRCAVKLQYGAPCGDSGVPQ